MGKIWKRLYRSYFFSIVFFCIGKYFFNFHLSYVFFIGFFSIEFIKFIFRYKKQWNVIGQTICSSPIKENLILLFNEHLSLNPTKYEYAIRLLDKGELSTQETMLIFSLFNHCAKNKKLINVDKNIEDIVNSAQKTIHSKTEEKEQHKYII